MYNSRWFSSTSKLVVYHSASCSFFSSLWAIVPRSALISGWAVGPTEKPRIDQLASLPSWPISLYTPRWAIQKVSDQSPWNYYRFNNNFLIVAVISLLAGGCFVGMIVTSSKRLHNKLLVSILKSSLRFFESTPTGRILNRFTKDVEATEEAIPNSLQSLLECLFGILSALIIICTTTPLIIIILVPIAVVYIFVQRYFIPSNRQLKRMFAASKSPVFSHFSETQVGVSTIRAFGGEEWAINAMEEKVNANILLYYCNIVSNRWLALRLELVSPSLNLSI